MKAVSASARGMARPAWASQAPSATRPSALFRASKKGVVWCRPLARCAPMGSTWRKR